MTVEQKLIKWQEERIKTLEKVCQFKQAFIAWLFIKHNANERE